MNLRIPSFSHPKTTEKILSRMPVGELAGKRVLDLGAGAGYFSWKLSERLEAAGIDPSAVIAPCDLHPENFQVPGLECRLGDFSAGLDFPDASFDWVVCVEVVEHVPDQLALFREMARVLKPGGRALVTTPNLLNANSRLRFLFGGTWLLFDILPIAEPDVVSPGGHIHPSTLYYLFYYARCAGFQEVDFHIDRVKKGALALAPPIWLVAKAYHAWRNLHRRKKPHFGENEPALRQLNAWKTFVGRTIILEAVR